MKIDFWEKPTTMHITDWVCQAEGLSGNMGVMYIWQTHKPSKIQEGRRGKEAGVAAAAAVSS